MPIGYWDVVILAESIFHELIFSHLRYINQELLETAKEPHAVGTLENSAARLNVLSPGFFM